MSEPLHALTVAQAAEALGVSERTVWRYLKAGRLAGETVGPPGAQRTLIPEATVDELRRGRGAGDGTDVAALRAEHERLVRKLAAVQAERDALHARVLELERAVARPAVRAPGREQLGRAVAAVAGLRASRPLARRLSPPR
jgi:excisionase family DNA binding protein